MEIVKDQKVLVSLIIQYGKLNTKQFDNNEVIYEKH